MSYKISTRIPTRDAASPRDLSVRCAKASRTCACSSSRSPTPNDRDAICISLFTRNSVVSSPIWTLESSNDSHAPWLSRTHSIVQSPTPSHPFSNTNEILHRGLWLDVDARSTAPSRPRSIRARSRAPTRRSPPRTAPAPAPTPSAPCGAGTERTPREVVPEPTTRPIPPAPSFRAESTPNRPTRAPPPTSGPPGCVFSHFSEFVEKSEGTRRWRERSFHSCKTRESLGRWPVSSTHDCIERERERERPRGSLRWR